MSSTSLIKRLAGAGRRYGRALQRGLALAALGLPLLAGPLAAAQVLSSEAAPTHTLHVPMGKAAALTLPDDVETVVVSQPETARAEVTGPRNIFVLGRGLGTTNILVYGRNTRLLEVVDVEVGYDAGELQDDLAAALPVEAVKVRPLNQGLLLTGRVSSSEAAATAEALAQRAAPDAVVSHLQVAPTQVRLEVRMIETSTSQLRDLGLQADANDHSHFKAHLGSGPVGPDDPQTTVRLMGSVGRYDLDAALQTLERRGSVSVLARPSLTTLSGGAASFQSGGEFPYPVPQAGGRSTIEYHPYGTALQFQPDVLADGFIRLQLAAEVSTIDPTVAVRLSGVEVPGFATRRVATAAELRDGETLILAGMLADSAQVQDDRPPWLARLGDLLGARRGKAAHRELAILVTPHIVSATETPQLTPGLAEVAQLDDTVPGPVAPAERPGRPRTVMAHLRAIAHAGLDLSRRGWTTLTGMTHRVLAALAPKAAAS